MMRVYTISDLHLFCRRSRAEAHLEDLYQIVEADADVFVLNGDIFDFRWTTLPSIEATVPAALQWLRQLMQRAPRCDFHYVLGNHDCVRPFTRALDALALEEQRFQWHPHHLRLGHAVFLHGDVAHRPMDEAALAKLRRRWQNHPRRGPVMNHVWDAAFAVGVHKRIARRLSPVELVVPRIHHYIESIGHGPETGTREVFFGHTHVPVNDFDYRGLRYHNCGATLRGMEFQPLHTELTVSSAEADAYSLTK